jgi:hypothetical protein
VSSKSCLSLSFLSLEAFLELDRCANSTQLFFVLLSAPAFSFLSLALLSL